MTHRRAREFAVEVALKGMVDWLETAEPGETNPEYTRGVIACAAAAVREVASPTMACVDDIYGVLEPFVEGLNVHLTMSDQAFQVMLVKVCEACL